MLYVKLSFKNISKLFKEYSIYFITIIFCSSLFYGCNALIYDTNIIKALPGIYSMYRQIKLIAYVFLFYNLLCDNIFQHI